jgi:hypothetical protein
VATKQRLTAKRVRELLALKRVHNDFVLVGDTAGKVPYVTYRNGVAKQGIAAAWQVITPGRSTDAFGSPRDDYNKTFVVLDARSPESRNDTLNVALKWASGLYNVDLATEWMKTPFGGYTVRDHLNARLRELLPREFDPDYRDPTVKKIVDKLYGDDNDSPERMFRVVVQLYVQPEPPLYVRATDEDAARRQVTQLFTRLAGTRILDGLKLSVYDA